MVEQITLYTSKVCPFAHRAEIALEESGLPYTRFEVDMVKKPDWYASKINPASKVPAVSYGGPEVPPDQPSVDSVKLAESRVLIEFFADLTDVPILPKDPIKRAEVRFFIETVVSKVHDAFASVMRESADPATFLEAIEVLQSTLPGEGYAIGKWSIADAAVTPFLARAEVAFVNDLGFYKSGLGSAVWRILEQDPKYERFRKYFEDVKSRESFKKTFDAARVKGVFEAYFAQNTA